MLVIHAGIHGVGVRQQGEFHWARSGSAWVSVILGHMVNEPGVLPSSRPWTA